MRAKEEAQQRQIESSDDLTRRTLARFVEVANAAGNPGASPWWLQPKGLSEEECGRRYMRAARKMRCSDEKRARLQAEHLATKPPVGHGWLAKVQSPGTLPARTESRGDVDMEWSPVVMTTGEVRACLTKTGSHRYWVGSPLLCQPHSFPTDIGLATVNAGRACEAVASRWEAVLTTDDIHALAARLDLDLT